MNYENGPGMAWYGTDGETKSVDRMGDVTLPGYKGAGDGKGESKGEISRWILE